MEIGWGGAPKRGISSKSREEEMEFGWKEGKKSKVPIAVPLPKRNAAQKVLDFFIGAPVQAADLDKIKQLEMDLDKKKEGFTSQQRLAQDSRYLALEKKERSIIKAEQEEESFWGGLWKKFTSTLSMFKDKASRLFKNLWDKLKAKLTGSEEEKGEIENPLYAEFRRYKAQSDKAFYTALGFDVKSGNTIVTGKHT